MKKFLFILSAFLFTAVIACNNTEKKPDEPNDTQKTQADSLEKEVMDGHNVGMAKMSRISKLQKEAKRLIDSIGRLPAKAQQAGAPYKARLNSLIKDLENAGSGMNQWMEEFRYDSARDNIAQRIKYLSEEKLKVGKVKEAILGSLQKADSLIKTKL